MRTFPVHYTSPSSIICGSQINNAHHRFEFAGGKYQHKTHKHTHHIPCCRSFLLGSCVSGPEASLCYATVVSLTLSNSLLPVTEECLLCWWILSLLYCFCSPRSDKRHAPSPSFTHWVMRMHLASSHQRC